MSNQLAKGGFVLSVFLVGLFYGWAARNFGWFPNERLARALDQARPFKAALFGDPPEFTERRVYDRSGVTRHEPDRIAAGLTLLPSNWESFGWKPGLKLIDQRGRVVHQWKVEPAKLFPDAFLPLFTGMMNFSHPYGSYLFPNGDVLVIIWRTGIARLDACGKVKWRLPESVHHSIARASDGSFWLSAGGGWAPDPFFEGTRNIRHDQILRISPDGEILDRINVFDVMRKKQSLLRRYLRYRPVDTHLNDVEVLPDSLADEYPLFEEGDLAVSLRHLSTVFVMDPESLRVRWEVEDPLVRQHDPDFIGDGWIGVFNDREDGTERGDRLGGSQIIEFQPHTGATKVTSPTEPFYTSSRGNWQQLGNGNFLLTEANRGRVVEMAPSGETVWEWIHPPYDDSAVPRLYWVERYEITRQQARDWPCSPSR